MIDPLNQTNRIMPRLKQVPNMTATDAPIQIQGHERA